MDNQLPRPGLRSLSQVPNVLVALFAALIVNTASADDLDSAADEPTARVLNETLQTTDTADLVGAVLTPLLDRYAGERGIEATQAEIEAFTERLRRGIEADPNLNAEDDLTPDEKKEAERMRRDMARSIIQGWKVNRSLYREYGGRVIAQQLGPEPLDAYRKFLREREQAGDFAIFDPELESAFWDYLTDESRHDFLGEEAARSAFDTPPWEG